MRKVILSVLFFASMCGSWTLGAKINNIDISPDSGTVPCTLKTETDSVMLIRTNCKYFSFGRHTTMFIPYMSVTTNKTGSFKLCFPAKVSASISLLAWQPVLLIDGGEYITGRMTVQGSTWSISPFDYSFAEGTSEKGLAYPTEITFIR